MSSRKFPVLFTTPELELIVNLLKVHVKVAQWEKETLPAELTEKLQRFLEIAKQLEPL